MKGKMAADLESIC